MAVAQFPARKQKEGTDYRRHHVVCTVSVACPEVSRKPAGCRKPRNHLLSAEHISWLPSNIWIQCTRACDPLPQNWSYAGKEVDNPSCLCCHNGCGMFSDASKPR